MEVMFLSRRMHVSVPIRNQHTSTGRDWQSAAVGQSLLSAQVFTLEVKWEQTDGSDLEKRRTDRRLICRLQCGFRFLFFFEIQPDMNNGNDYTESVPDFRYFGKGKIRKPVQTAQFFRQNVWTKLLFIETFLMHNCRQHVWCPALRIFFLNSRQHLPAYYLYKTVTQPLKAEKKFSLTKKITQTIESNAAAPQNMAS